MAANREIEKLERRWNENRQGTSFAPYAEALRKVGELVMAQEVLKQGLANHPDHIPGNIVLGRCCLDLKADGEAETAFTRVLGLDPENVIALKALADITERHERFAEAEQWLTQLINFDPSNDEAREQLARVEAARGQAASAMYPAASPPQGEPVPTGAPPAEPITERVAATALPNPDEEETLVVSAVRPARPAAPAPPPPLPEPEPVAAESDDIATLAMMPAASPEAMRPPTPQLEAVLNPGVIVPAAEPETMMVPEPAPMPDFEPGELDVTALGSQVDAEPIAGMVSEEQEPMMAPMPESGALSSHGGSGLDIGVEVPEEIELRPSGSISEFQTPSDSDDLLHVSGSVSEFQTPDAAHELLSSSPALGAHTEFQPSPDVLIPIEEPSRPEEPVRAATPAAGLPLIFPPGTETETSPELLEPVAAELPEPALAEMAESAADALPEPALAESEPEPPVLPEPALAAASSSSFPAIVPEPVVGEPELVVTETMAEVYVRQGHRVEALRVYRELLERSPGDERLLERVTELERDDRVSQAETAQWPAYAASVTGGQSVEAFFRSLLSHRLGEAVPTDGVAPVPATSVGTSAPGEPGHGAPTRPAQDPLSLSAIFGEEGGPGAGSAGTGSGTVDSGAPTPAAPGAPGYSFDQFFSGQAGAPTRPSSPGIRPSRPAGLEEDLDQFQNWLKGLKR